MIGKNHILILIAGAICVLLGVYMMFQGTGNVVRNTYRIPLSAPWTPTEITLIPGQTLTVSANGKGAWKNIPASNPNAFPNGFEECDPNGTPPIDPMDYYSNISSYPSRNANKGALIGKIGATGTPFNIGSNFSITITQAGELYLGINDMKLDVDPTSFSDNSGSYFATVEVK